MSGSVISMPDMVSSGMKEEGLSRRCRLSRLSLAAAPSLSEPSPSPSAAGAPSVVAEVPDLPDLRSEAVSSPEVIWPSVPVPPPPAASSFSSASSISASGSSSSSESSSSKPASSSSERPPSAARAVASVLCSATSCSSSFDAVPLASAGAACPAAREAIAASHALSSPARDGLAGLGGRATPDASGELFLPPSALPGRPPPLEPGVRVCAGAVVRRAGDAPFLCAFDPSTDDDAARSRTAVRPAPTESSGVSLLIADADDDRATSTGGASSASRPARSPSA
eukprot:scaffold88642_cov54-Phaeocystis_antarctica.AAC.2